MNVPYVFAFLPSSFPIPLRYTPVFGWCATRRAYFSLFFKASRALSSGVREHVLPPEVRSDTVQAVSDTILRRVHVRDPEIVETTLPSGVLNGSDVFETTDVFD